MKPPVFSSEQLSEIQRMIDSRAEEIVAQRLSAALIRIGQELAAENPQRRTVTAARSNAARSTAARPAERLPVQHQLMTGTQLAAALGLKSAWAIYAVKKANRVFHGQGAEPLIFSGRLSTPEKVSAWLGSHPEFNARRVLVSAGT